MSREYSCNVNILIVKTPGIYWASLEKNATLMSIREYIFCLFNFNPIVFFLEKYTNYFFELQILHFSEYC